MHSNATPKSATFQMRINPEVKRQAESVFAAYGLSLTDAVNLFIQQSLNTQGLPFLLSPENGAYLTPPGWTRKSRPDGTA